MAAISQSITGLTHLPGRRFALERIVVGFIKLNSAGGCRYRGRVADF